MIKDLSLIGLEKLKSLLKSCFYKVVGNQSTGNWANWHSYFEKQFDILSNNRDVKTTWLSNFTTRSIALEKLADKPWGQDEGMTQ